MTETTIEVKHFTDALKEMQNALDKNIEQKLKAQADNDAAAVKSLNEKIAEHNAQIEALAKKSNEIKTEQKAISSEEALYNSLKEQADYFKSMVGTKKDSVTIGMKAFQKKDATTMLTSSYDGIFGLTTFDPSIARVPRRKPFLRQIVNSFPVTSLLHQWAEESVMARQGDAATTSEGSLKSQISQGWYEDSKKVEKITAFTKASKESLSDISILMSEIQSDLLYRVNNKLDLQILDGDNSSPNLAGILGYAPSFDIAGTVLVGGTTNANEFDVIRAAAWQIEAAGEGEFLPNYVIVNPIQAAKMDLTKISDGTYIMPPFASANGQQIAGITVLTNSAITAGDFLVGDFSRSNLGIREDVNIQIGFENDDFTKNLVTMLAEVRAVHYIKSNHVGAFVKGTFSTAIAAIND